jgi:hypothetical protein
MDKEQYDKDCTVAVTVNLILLLWFAAAVISGFLK